MPGCVKIAKSSEVTRERARKRQAECAATVEETSTTRTVPVEQVLALGNKNCQGRRTKETAVRDSA